MALTRRALAATAFLLPGIRALAQGTGPAAVSSRLAERAVGKADAPVTVIEYFSLTCVHCAAFHRDTLPRVKQELVEPGRVRLVWRDFPLDGLALAAAAAARALPADRYEPFVGMLLSTQDRWAFARGVDNMAELARLAGTAGLSRADFDAAQADAGLRRGILELRLAGQNEHKVQATPSFVFGKQPTQAGALDFDRFAAAAKAAG